jgi:hypothetical protein
MSDNAENWKTSVGNRSMVSRAEVLFRFVATEVVPQPSRADVARPPRQVRFVPILLQKSFWGDERKFSGALTRVGRRDVRNHVVPRKNDHGPA